MRFFLNLRIRTRLLVAFILVALLAAAVGIVGSFNIGTVNAQGRWVYEKTTVPLGQLGLVMRDFQGIRITVYQGLRAPTPDAARERFNTLSDNKARIAQQLDGYTKTFIFDADEAEHELNQLAAKFQR